MSSHITRRDMLQSLGVGAASLALVRARQQVNSQSVRHTAKDLGIVPQETITIKGFEVRIADPPRGLVHRPDLGLLMSEGITAQHIHAVPTDTFTESPRAVIDSRGDYLTIFPAGKGHQFGAKTKVNEMVAYRSPDKGRTWQGPTHPWKVPYNQHAFNPLIPRGSRRIYTFGLEQPLETMTLAHSGPIAMRYSDDDGRNWSEPRTVRPANDPEYQGVCHMQMCQTEAGTWLLGTYTVRTRPDGSRSDRQRVLRSTDQGKTWTIIPGPEHGGWYVKEYDRMLEGRVMCLGRGRIVMFTRVPSGHMWELRSNDDGKTWSEPKPTALVHPDAPPMVYKLSDGKTLAAFIHNRPASHRYNIRNRPDRQDLWCSLSSDDGQTWSEPRYVLSDASEPFRNLVEVSYADLIIDGSDLHLLFSFQKRHIVHVKLEQKDLTRFPTQADLARKLKTSV